MSLSLAERGPKVRCDAIGGLTHRVSLVVEVEVRSLRPVQFFWPARRSCTLRAWLGNAEPFEWMTSVERSRATLRHRVEVYPGFPCHDSERVTPRGHTSTARIVHVVLTRADACRRLVGGW